MTCAARDHGGTAAIQVGPGELVFIGDAIFAFRTQQTDAIVEFWSPMGNSAVPYYLLAEQKVVTNKALRAWRERVQSTSTDPYTREN